MKFDHSDKTKDLAALHPRHGTLRAHKALKAHTFTRLPRPAGGLPFHRLPRIPRDPEITPGTLKSMRSSFRRL
jgi:hypothetical protein